MLSFHITSVFRLFAKGKTFVYIWSPCSQKFDNSRTSSIYFSGIDKNTSLYQAKSALYGVTTSRWENKRPVTCCAPAGGEQTLTHTHTHTHIHTRIREFLTTLFIYKSYLIKTKLMFMIIWPSSRYLRNRSTIVSSISLNFLPIFLVLLALFFEFSDINQSIHKDGFWQSLI